MTKILKYTPKNQIDKAPAKRMPCHVFNYKKAKIKIIAKSKY